MDKTDEKELEAVIKTAAKGHGFKMVSGIIWAIDSDWFNTCSPFISRKQGKIYYDVDVKKMVYDELFWDIMDMSDNRNARTSLRANGAFVSPSLRISQGVLDVGEPFDELAEELISCLIKSLADFKATVDNLSQHIVENPGDGYLRDTVLESLAYLDLGDIDSAKQIARDHFGKGRFVNGRKDFFERLLELYC